jgi:DNA-binding PadR family transcriptional regulator
LTKYPPSLYLPWIDHRTPTHETMPPGSHTTHPPLKPPVLHILVALSEGALHGLAIADHVDEASGGVIHLGPGTLYRSLDDMQEADLIQKSDPPSTDADPRRKYYRITPRGEGLLQLEMERFERLVNHARSRKILPRRA